MSQATGYRAFMPATLPPNPPLQLDDELLAILSQADQALGRLDASADIIPNPDLFVAMYVRKEAVLSSQIEGTQASLSDVLRYEAAGLKGTVLPDIAEVFNHVGAMNHGLQRLNELPLSNRLLREIHRELLRGVRGQEKSPGEFRRTQNWIGPANGGLAEAAFIPPPPPDMERAMGELEAYIHDSAPTPLLIKAGLIHAQFETIHPFLDGNGRIGRLLITFFLCQHGVLKRPLLYLSAYFKQFRQEYYDRLQAIRESGDWEGWLKFFLTAIFQVAREASDTARNIVTMREAHRLLIQRRVPGAANGLQLLDLLYKEPYLSVSRAATLIDVAFQTANLLISSLEDLKLLVEVTGQERNRVFRYEPYLALLEAGIGSAQQAST